MEIILSFYLLILIVFFYLLLKSKNGLLRVSYIFFIIGLIFMALGELIINDKFIVGGAIMSSVSLMIIIGKAYGRL